MISRAGTQLLITLSLYMQYRTGPQMEGAWEMCRRDVVERDAQAAFTHTTIIVCKRFEQ